MAGLTADQIIERIANANGVDPAVIKPQIEHALRKIIAETTQPHSSMLADLFPGGNPTVDELIVTLEHKLYDTMMPKIPGWEWDGEGYRNIKWFEKNSISNNECSAKKDNFVRNPEVSPRLFLIVHNLFTICLSLSVMM